VGTGWAFAANAFCYLGPTVGLLRLRPADLVPAPATLRKSAAPGQPGALGQPGAPGQPEAPRTALRYLRSRPDIAWTIFLVGMFGTFGLNFPIVLTAMAKSAFGGDASTYGLFNIILAIGSATGALLAGAGSRPKTRRIMIAAAVFGLLQATAAFAPDMALFLALLCAMGLANLMFQAWANSFVQLAVDPELRGRIMGVYMLALIGGTPIGAPLIGALTTHYGARAGMAVCGAVPVLAVLIMTAVLAAGLIIRRRHDTPDALLSDTVSPDTMSLDAPPPATVPSDTVQSDIVPFDAPPSGRQPHPPARLRWHRALH
jgi:MFS family permease